MEFYHTPVMLSESLEMLDVKPDGVYVDLTFGGGGHSRAILGKLSDGGTLYGFDQDAEAAANVPDDPRFRFVEGNFRFMRGLLRARGVTQVDGILADLGVSSRHFDAPERGFSFRADAPLDMRMNARGRLTAAAVVNGYPAERLARILREYGELDSPHRAAARIAASREQASLQTTMELVEAVRPLIPRRDENKYLSKLFQALRIEVNGEIEALKMALEQSLKVLAPGGRLVVISYHSLEDRLVKNFMKAGNFTGEAEKDFYGRTEPPLTPLTRKAAAPSDEEVERNPRSRSARLRAAVKN